MILSTVRKFIFIIIGVIGILITACKHEKTEISQNNDPFVFNMTNYFDFLRQGHALIQKDSNRYGYARVVEILVDSITLNDSDKEKIKFIYEHSFEYDKDYFKVSNFNLKYSKDDIILYNTEDNKLYHSFYPTLEALKQMKHKSENKPQYNFLMDFADNKDISYQAFYNKNLSQWEFYILLFDLKSDSIRHEIKLNNELLDSLIYKMDNMRTYLLRGGDDTFIDDLISGKRKMN